MEKEPKQPAPKDGSSNRAGGDRPWADRQLLLRKRGAGAARQQEIADPQEPNSPTKKTLRQE